MKRFISIVVFALIAVAIAAPSFAKSKKIASVVAEKAPRIVEFSSRGFDASRGGYTDAEYMQSRQAEALAKANEWLRNTKNVRVISHSVAPNYSGGGHTTIYGFTTVTILYEEK